MEILATIIFAIALLVTMLTVLRIIHVSVNVIAGRYKSEAFIGAFILLTVLWTSFYYVTSFLI